MPHERAGPCGAETRGGGGGGGGGTGCCTTRRTCRRRRRCTGWCSGISSGGAKWWPSVVACSPAPAQRLGVTVERFVLATMLYTYPLKSNAVSTTTGLAGPQGPLLLYPLDPGFPADVNLETLSTEQLLRMEGNERAAIQERIRVLQKIQQQISTVIVTLVQYQQLTAASAPSSPATSSLASASAAAAATASASSGPSATPPNPTSQQQ